MTEKIPTAKLQVADPDNWLQEATALAEELIAKGESPRFEVRWPAPAHLSPREKANWLEKQEAVFDALSYDPETGEFTTLPPYSEMEAAQ